MVTTITIREGTKEMLKAVKGKKDWDTFLKELVEEYTKIRREKARKELKNLLKEGFEDIRVRSWAREF